LLLAHDLDDLSRDAYVALNEQVTEVKRMLYRFMQSLNLGRAEGRGLFRNSSCKWLKSHLRYLRGQAVNAGREMLFLGI
jgi:hypothetical protein